MLLMKDLGGYLTSRVHVDYNVDYKNVESQRTTIKFLAFGVILLIVSAGVQLTLWLLSSRDICKCEKIVNCEVKDEPEKKEKFWFEDLPIPPLVISSSKTLEEGSCKMQLQKYIEELKNGTLWATQMFDASVKYPYGIIDGLTRHLGSFDQCYRIESSLRWGNENEEIIRGRYCLVNYKYQQKHGSTDFNDKLTLDFDPNESVWESIREKGDFRRNWRYMLQMAICVPATCSAEDIQKALYGPYTEFAEQNELIIEIKVNEKNCQTYDEQPSFSIGNVLIIWITVSLAVLCIITLVIVSSWYEKTHDIDQEQENSRNIQLLLCFSLSRNIESIFEINYKHRGLDTIHLFRFISMCLVIFGHRALQYYLNPVVNKQHLEMSFDISSFIMLFNGPILVDGFFAIGGLLTCYGFLDHFDKAKHVNFGSLILLRFLRFTPVYALIIFFNAYLFPHLGSGPLWRSIIDTEADNCASVWWANLLYLNTYLTMDKICIFQSWYLAIDFHCYLIAIVLVYEFWKCPRRIGYWILGGATFISILIPFFITFIHSVQPFFIAFPYLTNLQMDSYFCNYYVKTHLRMTAYLVGIISGAVLYDHQKQPWQIPKNSSKILFVILVAGMCNGAQALGYQYLNPNSNPSSFSMALYGSLHRGAFAVGVCSIVLLVTIGDGLDSHYRFLTPSWAQPLGRLTYSVFLSHNIIQMYHAGTARSARTFSMHNLLWDLVPDIIFSFSLAFLIVISIEAPFRKMEKFFIMKLNSKHTKDELVQEDKVVEMQINR